MRGEVWLTIEEAAALESISLDSMLKRIQRNRTSFTTRQIPSEKQSGKTVTQILLSSLSDKAQRAYRARAQAAVIAEHAEILPIPTKTKTPHEQMQWYYALPADHQARVDARRALVFEYQRGALDLEGRHGLISDYQRDFCEKQGVSRGTLYRLIAAWESDGLIGLRDGRYGQSRTKLERRHADYIVACIDALPHAHAALIHIKLQEYFSISISYNVVRRFVSAWKHENRALFTAMRNPDDWRSNFQIAFGSQSVKATHFLHYIEMDSTPADVLCADGKRYALVCAIDIYSRKAKVVVSARSNSWAIAGLFRSIVTEWGVPEFVIKDNGQDYMSKHITQILAAFSVLAPKVPAFTPEAKPHVERFCQTLSHGLLEELPGFIGHSVADRKGIEARRSFADRIMKTGETLEIGLMPEQLQEVIDAWLDRVYHQRMHRGIKMSPEAMAAQSTKVVSRVTDLAALDIVLLPSLPRVVGKKGIQCENGLYQAPELAFWVGQPVQVKVDVKNVAIAYIYSEEGLHICTAYDAKALPMTQAQLNEARNSQKKELRAQLRGVKALRDQFPDADLAIAGLNKKMKKVTALVRTSQASNNALTEGARAAGGLGQEPIGQRLLREFRETGTD